MLPAKVKNLWRLLHCRRVMDFTSLTRKAYHSRLVLGIETSCDDTGAAVLDETGTILGESLYSQNEVHLRTGGIIPTVAQQLHRESIEVVVHEALERSGVTPSQLSAVATTVKPGLALSLGIGLAFSQKFPVPFPFLVLLVSGGHSLLAVARGIDDFLLLGYMLDEAPGDTLDKVARRLSLTKHPDCSTLSGGQAIELLARSGDRRKFPFRTPMGRIYDCCFSFAGLRSQITMSIIKKEAEEGIEQGTLLSCVNDIAAGTQHTVAVHLAKRTHRAILFCKENGLLPSDNPILVVSGGVASNQYICKALTVITEKTGLRLLCPPPRFCTDNGVMIAWNGIERLKEGRGILSPSEDVCYEPKAPLGVDISAKVRAAGIRLPPVRMKILS
ncbi:tRNA N6-adenosine threonylcarbamoyltransferase, mitochondrial isoform X2 [Oryzias latipes]